MTPSLPALKEWSAAIHALLAGKQTVLLRKGGIGEKRFEVALADPAAEFLLFPTVAHSHTDRVRPQYRDLVAAAAGDSTESRVMLRAAARLVAALPVNRPEGLAAIEDLHIWTAESVRADRLDFRPKHRLTVLVVQVAPITPVHITRTAAHAGCTSWLPPSFGAPADLAVGDPVYDAATLAQVSARVREAVG